MANETIEREYRRLRGAGWRACDAWRAACTRAAFDALEAAGVVRLRVEVDEVLYDDSYIDTWTDKTEAWRKRERKETWARIEHEGVWGLISEYLDPVDGWVTIWDCWGFIGDDWRDSGYDTDARGAAVKAFEAIDVALCEGWA